METCYTYSGNLLIQCKLCDHCGHGTDHDLLVRMEALHFGGVTAVSDHQGGRHAAEVWPLGRNQ